MQYTYFDPINECLEELFLFPMGHTFLFFHLCKTSKATELLYTYFRHWYSWSFRSSILYFYLMIYFRHWCPRLLWLLISNACSAPMKDHWLLCLGHVECAFWSCPDVGVPMDFSCKENPKSLVGKYSIIKLRNYKSNGRISFDNKIPYFSFANKFMVAN